MKKIKSIIAVLVSAVTCITCGGAVSVSAATYDPCDVNRDGVVNVADVVTINAYLIGDLYSSNYNIFDANRSLTIDYSDSDCVLAKVAMLSYSAAYYSRKANATVAFPTVSGFKPDSAASSTVGRKYRRYSYANKKQLSNYTLNPASQANSSISTLAVIDGADSRKPSRVEENAGIVRLTYKISDTDDYHEGTGFIVGDHQIATAAHCVYSKEENSWYYIMNDISKYESDGTLGATYFTPVEAHIPDEYVNLPKLGDAKIEYDYALITVKEDLSEYVHFDLGASYNVTETNYKNIPLYVTGMPEVVKGDENVSRCLYTCEGNVITQDNTSILYHNIDTSSGQSGSPVYTITRNNKGEYTYTALAIHHGTNIFGSKNTGPLITKYHLQFYRNNTYANY